MNLSEQPRTWSLGTAVLFSLRQLRPRPLPLLPRPRSEDLCGLGNPRSDRQRSSRQCAPSSADRKPSDASQLAAARSTGVGITDPSAGKTPCYMSCV